MTAESTSGGYPKLDEKTTTLEEADLMNEKLSELRKMAVALRCSDQEIANSDDAATQEERKTMLVAMVAKADTRTKSIAMNQGRRSSQAASTRKKTAQLMEELARSDFVDVQGLPFNFYILYGDAWLDRFKSVLDEQKEAVCIAEKTLHKEVIVTDREEYDVTREVLAAAKAGCPTDALQESQFPLHVSYKPGVPRTVQEKLKKVQAGMLAHKGRNNAKIEVRRDCIIESLRVLAIKDPSRLLCGLDVTFSGEDGFGPGVMRDYLTSLAAALEKVGKASILCETVTGLLKPAPSLLDEQGKLCFRGLGRFFGLLLCYEHPVPIVSRMSPIVFKLLRHKNVSLKDAEAEDSESCVLKTCTKLLKKDGVEELKTFFGVEKLFMVSIPTESDNRTEQVALCEDGENVEVTEDNKLEYMNLLLYHFLFSGFHEEFKEIQRGFWDLAPLHVMRDAHMTHVDLKLILAGESQIDSKEWKNNSQLLMNNRKVMADMPEYNTGPIAWFFEVMEEGDAEFRQKVLNFCTARTSLPEGNFAKLDPTFVIKIKDSMEVTSLPQSHTCGNTLEMPYYESKEALKKKLSRAIDLAVGGGLLLA